MALIERGRQHRPRDRDPRACPRRLPALPAEPALPGPPARAALDTPAHIYYKYEGGSPSGSHKPNTALAQAFYNKERGRHPAGDRDRRRPVGSALAFAGAVLRARGQGLHGPRQLRPEAVPPDPDGDLRRGGRRQPVAATPTTGARSWPRRPDTPGSLGHRDQRGDRGRRDASGTRSTRSGRCFDFVLLHQTVIGQEAIEQMAMAGEEPDVIIGCAGGGSNFAGLTFPLLGADVPRAARSTGSIAVEPEAAPSADPRRLRLRLRRHRAR